MPIDSKHPAYEAMEEAWQKCRDTYKGHDAVQAAGETYLPKLQVNQRFEEYLAYKKRALFYEAVGRTVDGLAGAATRKDPRIELPNSLEGFVKREDIVQSVSEVILTGRTGLFVDMSREGSVPYINVYDAEQVVNWRVTETGVPTLVVLRENAYEPKDADPYVLEEVTRYRELYLESGVYKVRLWEKGGDKNDKFEVVEEIDPRNTGQPLNRIPFFPINPKRVSWDIFKPPMLGVVVANLRHYINDADLQWGLRWTALPQAWVSGVQADDDEPLSLGSSRAWVLGEEGRAGYLEFQGTGLQAIERSMDRLERLMATLGARILEGQRAQVETAEVSRMRQAGEHSVLISIVLAVAQAFTLAGQFAAEWVKANPKEVGVELNTDFISERLKPAELQALLQTYQSGAMSFDTFIHNLREGEMLPEGRTAEEEERLIAEGNVPAPGTGEEVPQEGEGEA